MEKILSENDQRRIWTEISKYSGFVDTLNQYELQVMLDFSRKTLAQYEDDILGKHEDDPMIFAKTPRWLQPYISEKLTFLRIHSIKEAQVVYSLVQGKLTTGKIKMPSEKSQLENDLNDFLNESGKAIFPLIVQDFPETTKNKRDTMRFGILLIVLEKMKLLNTDIFDFTKTDMHAIMKKSFGEIGSYRSFVDVINKIDNFKNTPYKDPNIKSKISLYMKRVEEYLSNQ